MSYIMPHGVSKFTVFHMSSCGICLHLGLTS